MCVLTCSAQPSWVKKASKSVFTLKTFDNNNQLLSSSNGFFIGSNGEAVSCFSPFRGARRAIVIDSQDHEYGVVSIIGANDTYDVVKFRVDNRKTPALTLASTTAAEGQPVWIMPYREVKNPPKATIRMAERFDGDYAYYTVSLPLAETSVGCPLVNESGEVVGLMQPAATVRDTLSYAVSALFTASLKTSGLTYNDASLRSTSIRKELPSELNEATLCLYMANSTTDSAEYSRLVEDFIRQFPSVPDGFIYRAQLAVSGGNFPQADRDMEQAVKIASPKDNAYYSFARLIYNKEVYQSDISFSGWSLDKALSLVREAIGINSQPAYRQLEANILFAQQQYAAAADIYQELTQTPLRGADVFYSAAHCQELLSDTTAMLQLADSAVACFSKPYLNEAAPYIWARAQMRMKARKWREAVADFNDYEEIMAAKQLTDEFYYVRYKAELEGHLYQQALNDLDRALALKPASTLYLAEKASLQIRVGFYADAAATARECIAAHPSESDGYLFLGLAQCLLGQKEEGLANLRKAKDLGDPQADGLIEKYS